VDVGRANTHTEDGLRKKPAAAEGEGEPVGAARWGGRTPITRCHQNAARKNARNLFISAHTHLFTSMCSSGAITIYARMLGVINRHLYYDEPESAPTGYWSLALSDIDENKWRPCPLQIITSWKMLWTIMELSGT
jgi:hypothetical protein